MIMKKVPVLFIHTLNTSLFKKENLKGVSLRSLIKPLKTNFYHI